MPSAKRSPDGPDVFSLKAHQDEMDDLMARGDHAVARAHRLHAASNHADGVCLICGSDPHDGGCLMN